MHTPAPRGYGIRMSLFFGGVFFPMGIYIPFFGLWLQSLGMSAEEIGLVLTIPMITKAICPPFMAAIADKIGDRRLTLRIYSFAFGLSFALITLNDSLVWVALVMAVSHIAQGAINPVADSLAMAGTRRYSLDYGKMRGLGSLAFVLANLIGGAVLTAFGVGVVAWMMVLGNLLHMFFSLTLPMDPRLIDNKKLSKGTRLDAKQLKQFAQIGFWVVILASCIVQASHSLLYAFGTIYWEKIGISANVIGMFWSISVLAEVGLFMLSKRIGKKFGWKQWLLVGAAFATARWLIFPLGLSESGYFFLQMFHAASFACTHLGSIYFIGETVDDGLSGTAQGLYTMAIGVTMAIVTTLSGVLYARWEEQSFYVMGAISLIGMLLLLLVQFFPIGHISEDEEPASV